jgi:hypothetical protein
MEDGENGAKDWNRGEQDIRMMNVKRNLVKKNYV